MRTDHWDFTCSRCHAVCLPVEGLCQKCWNRSLRRGNWLAVLCLLGWIFGACVAIWVIASLMTGGFK